MDEQQKFEAGDAGKMVSAMLKTEEPTDAQTIDAAEKLAQSIEDEDNRAMALEQIVEALLRTNDWTRAEEITQGMPVVYEKADAYRKIAVSLLKANQIESAIEFVAISRTIPGGVGGVDIEWERADVLNEVAKALFSANQIEKAREFWDEAIAEANQGEVSDDPPHQHSLDASSMLSEIAETLALAGEWQKAKEVARNINSLPKRAQALSALERIRRGEAGHYKISF